ncbi:MAG: hypothetical protein J1D87_03555 [Lachnospiraceae bacterium]|nr:hypothetical protein [Lachnospiraceae bacterium]
MKKSQNNKPIKGLSIITSNKTIFSSIIISIYIIIIILLYNYFNNDLESTYYISQIIGGIFIISGLVVSVLQYMASYVDNLILRDKEKKIRAAEMADKFQAEIIPLSNILSKAFSHSDLTTELLPKIENKKLEMFDKEEVLSIVTEQERKATFSKLYAGYLFDHFNENNVEKSENDKITKMKFSIFEKVKAEETIDTCIQDLANKLEYFSICFNSGIADEDTVYQSLHDVYFQCVHMLYIFIFYSNTSESNRLFSNVSSLYSRWHKRYEALMEQEDIEIANMKRSVKKQIVVEVKNDISTKKWSI